jgi:hypothetical protein
VKICSFYNYRQTTVFVLGKYFLLNHVRCGNFCYVLTPKCVLQCRHIVYQFDQQHRGLTIIVKRANFHKARKVYNLFKNDINRDQLNKTSREFKRALSESVFRFSEHLLIICQQIFGSFFDASLISLAILF